ncbi:MAG: HAD-IC family P-type ATPase, partial [Candidatus Aminicenantes bacterium]|nr:HAD-IC family P-type ATPase [Candidatus Aminicenantes bacterium]
VSLLASDKTGTLTKNQMTVVKLYFDEKIIEVSGEGYEPEGKFYHNKEELKEKEKDFLFPFIEAGVLCNDSKIFRSKGNWIVDGDPTEGALVVLGEKVGLKKGNLENIFPRIDERPFESKTSYMATLHKNLDKEGNVIFVKGAPEKIIEMSSQYYLNGKKIRFSSDYKKKIIQESINFSSQALRVIAVAKKELKTEDKNIKKSNLSNLIFLGFLGMYDPPRPEAKEAVRQCRRSGIRVFMITGDHSITAKAIAKQIGIIEGDKEQVVSGEELERMGSGEFKDTLGKISVYARISPQMKFRIVETLQDKGWIVGVTGDGVNDAPALKKADIGIAMGTSGT